MTCLTRTKNYTGIVPYLISGQERQLHYIQKHMDNLGNIIINNKVIKIFYF